MGCNCIPDVVASEASFGILDFKENVRKYMKEYF